MLTCTRYIVMTSTAQVKGKAKLGRYRNVAVVETDGQIPAMISAHAKHTVRIVKHFGACSYGRTERCEYRRVLRIAEALADQLNAGQEEDAP